MAHHLKRGRSNESPVEEESTTKKLAIDVPPLSCTPPNPNLLKLTVDHLYHLGLDTYMDLQGIFGDTKYVCMGGSNDRMHAIAERVKATLSIGKQHPAGTALVPIGKQERYHLYKVGPVICVSHGMGMPSMMILLHEIAKLLRYAKAKDFVFIRIGTAGGIGISPGSVVLTTESLNTSLNPFHETRIFGKVISTPTILSKELNEKLVKHAGSHVVYCGKTLCTSDFYEEQGRMDGYFCDFTEEHRANFMNSLHNMGVMNIEMESEAFASFCYRANFPAAIVCGILVNRLGGDQVTSTSEELAQYAQNAVTLVLSYIKARVEAGLNPLD